MHKCLCILIALLLLSGKLTAEETVQTDYLNDYNAHSSIRFVTSEEIFIAENDREKTMWGAVRIDVQSGSTEVTSSITRDSGSKDVIANGEAEYSGFSIIFEQPTIERGWSYSVSPKLYSKTVTISDFRENIPLVDVPDTENIPYVVVTYADGYAVDPLDENRYDITVQGLGLTVRHGYSFSKQQIFNGFLLKRILPTTFMTINLSLGADLVEYRGSKVELGNETVEDQELLFFHRFMMGMSAVLQFPKSHSAFSMEFVISYDREYQIPGQLEFRDNVSYDPENNIFYRERVFLDKIELVDSYVQISYTYLF